jgi:glucose/arabinose dehydrogenase
MIKRFIAATSIVAITIAPALAQKTAVNVEPVATFNTPWAMTFLPDGRLLVSEKRGQLHLVDQSGQQTPITGLPATEAGGQGGMGDVVLHPKFAVNQLIYISYVEPGKSGTRGSVVLRAKLDLSNQTTPKLIDQQTIWKQFPKVTGYGHFGQRIAFSPDGFLFISSGERQKFDPSQDMQQNLGKIIRLKPDGSIPADNPFVGQGDLAKQFWSIGHRNPLGLAFDADGQLWNHEMGPRGGDELNRVERGANYGYPIVSNGDHYSGAEIPDHDTRPEFKTPALWWTPVISPGGLAFYSGKLFKSWQSNALIAGLSARALVRVGFNNGKATEIERIDLGARIREVEQGPQGAVWVLEDGRSGRLLKLTPK